MKRTALLLVITLLAACEIPGEHPVVGTLERDRIVMTSEAREPIIAIMVREGDRVEAGATLVTLDPARARSELDRLDARREQLQRRHDELVRGPRAEAISEARARLARARSVLAGAEREFERIRDLNAQSLASERELDAARTGLETARADLDAAASVLAELTAGTTAEELDQADAALDEAKAAIATQRLTLARLTVTAPRAAVVEALPFEVGETPAVGAPVAILRALDTPPYARVFVPAAMRAKFTPGTRVRVTVDGHGQLDGWVRFISSEAAYTPYFALTEHDAGRLSYLAEIELDAGDELPVGVPVRAVAIVE